MLVHTVCNYLLSVKYGGMQVLYYLEETFHKCYSWLWYLLYWKPRNKYYHVISLDFINFFKISMLRKVLELFSKWTESQTCCPGVGVRDAWHPHGWWAMTSVLTLSLPRWHLPFLTILHQTIEQGSGCSARDHTGHSFIHLAMIY